MDPGICDHQRVDLTVRHEGDSAMISPDADVGEPLQSRPEGGSVSTVVVEHKTVTKYVATVRAHEVRVDQPLADGGTDEAPSPVELFVVSLATCVAYFAGRYLERHGLSREGFAVHAEYRKADRPPARIASIHLRVIVPAGLPAGLVKPLHAVVSHCTVHNSLREPPTVDIQIDGRPMPD
jgi:putative redox protein